MKSHTVGVDDLVVRRASAPDAEAMAQVYVAAACEGWPHIFPANRLAQLDPPVISMAAQMENRAARRAAFVAELDGAVVGYAVVRPSEDADADPGRVGELHTFYSHPSVWGRGVGRALMRDVLASLRSAGFVEATLWTPEANHRPRAIYEAAGWLPDGAVRERRYLDVEYRELRHRIVLGS